MGQGGKRLEVRFAVARQLLVGAAVVIFIAVVPFLRVAGADTQPGLATLYTIPVAIAALVFNPIVALSITTLALTCHSVDAWISQVALLPWAAQAFVLISIAFLGIKWTQQERGVDALMAKTRRLSEERVQLIDKLTESRLEREQFIGAIMYETKGVLTAVLSFASSLARRGDFCSDEEQRGLENVVNQARHLSRLVNDMQTASQIERGRFAISSSEGELRKLVSRVVLEQQTLTTRHELVLKVPDEDVKAVFDHDQIERALENLVRNAINFSPHGGKIDIDLVRLDNSVRISIVDHGIGIAQMDLPRLFKPYVRLAPARDMSGIGLGLYVTKAIIEAHGGQIRVESKLGYGSTFSFELPLIAAKSFDHTSSGSMRGA